MLFVFAFITPAAAQCQECEAACFSDCSNKYKAEIIDPDMLPGGGGNAGVFVQTDKIRTQMSKSYLECMDQSHQCTLPKVAHEHKSQTGRNDTSIDSKLTSAMQKWANHKCVQKLSRPAASAGQVEKQKKDARKMLRHTKQLKEIAALQEDSDPPFGLVKPHYLEHNAFHHGYLKLSQCLDICISTHCPCPNAVTGDFFSRYPEDLPAAAAEAAGVPTAEDSAEQAAAAEATQPQYYGGGYYGGYYGYYYDEYYHGCYYDGSCPYYRCYYDTSCPWYYAGGGYYGAGAHPCDGMDCPATNCDQCLMYECPNQCCGGDPANDGYDYFMGCLMGR